MSERQRRQMEIAARVRWPGNVRRGILTTDHPQSSHGVPVLILDGEVYSPGDLPPDSMVVVAWAGPYSKPVWQLVRSAKEDAKYPIRFLATSKD